MPKRILQIIPTLDRGGAEKQLTTLATHLPSSDFEVHVATLTRNGPYEADLQAANIPVHAINKRGKLDPLAYGRLKKLIQKLQPDLVHTWLFAANSYGRQAAMATGVKKIVAGERCVDQWKRWHHWVIDRKLARRTDAIATNSPAVRDYCAEHGIAADKFTVIPNGIDLPPQLSADEKLAARKKLLAELNLPDDAKLIAAVGRLWPQKRIKDLIWGNEVLRVIREDSHMLIIGDGPQRWRMERFAWQVRVEERTHFLGNRDDVLNLLPHCVCLWLASGYEGQSNAIMEAMASGLPVVATDIPGNAELVVPEETGFLFPVGARTELTRYTHKFMEQPELAEQMGAAGRERIAQHFSVAKMVDSHADLYRRLLD